MVMNPVPGQDKDRYDLEFELSGVAEWKSFIGYCSSMRKEECQHNMNKCSLDFKKNFRKKEILEDTG